MQCNHFGIFMTDILLVFIWQRHSTELFVYIYLFDKKTNKTKKLLELIVRSKQPASTHLPAGQRELRGSRCSQTVFWRQGVKGIPERSGWDFSVGYSSSPILPTPASIGDQVVLTAITLWQQCCCRSHSQVDIFYKRQNAVWNINYLSSKSVVLLFQVCMQPYTCPQAHLPQCDKLQQLLWWSSRMTPLWWCNNEPSPPDRF